MTSENWESQNGIMAKNTESTLKYRKRSIWLLTFYLPILIVPWALICVLMFRPISLPAYINQRGEYSMTDMQKVSDWMTAIDVLSRVAATVGLPVVSALIAQAVVVYSQVKKASEKKSLSVLQLFALSDRGWMDLPILWSSAFGSPSRSSKFLWLAAGLALITVAQPPIQSLLTPRDPLLIVTCNDNPVEITNSSPTCDKVGLHSRIVAYDPEPNDMEHIPRGVVISKIRDKIRSTSLLDLQMNLWHEHDDNFEVLPVEQMNRQTFAWLRAFEDASPKYFASAVANGTTTGVLREHALRLNSSVKCEILESKPSSCAGSKPFFTEFEHTGRYSTEIKTSICVEGDHSAVPWSRSRDKQDITERMWMSVEGPKDSLPRETVNLAETVESFIISCNASSTRGYFELGNYQNGQQFQDLLDKWPDRGEMNSSYNDYTAPAIDRQNRDRRPATEEPESEPRRYLWNDPPDLFRQIDTYAPGPLALTMLSLFGNSTFFHLASSRPESTMNDTMLDICQTGNYPFHRASTYNMDYTRLCYKYENESGIAYQVYYGAPTGTESAKHEILPLFIAKVMEIFASEYRAEEVLDMGMFFANEALLTAAASSGTYMYSRSIYSSPGWVILKPRKSVTAIIVVSVLIALQAVCLIWLVWYIASTATWTDRLDSFALAQIGAQLDGLHKEGLTSEREQYMVMLSKRSGLVGLNEAQTEEMKDRASTDEASAQGANHDAEGSSSSHAITTSAGNGDAIVLGGTGALGLKTGVAGWFGWRRGKGKYAPVEEARADN